MKAFVTMAAACLLALGMTGAASADEHSNGDTTGNPAKGNQGCILFADGSTHKNPGKLMQYLRAKEEIGGYPAGGNVNDWLDNFAGYGGTAGDWINRNCGPDEPS